MATNLISKESEKMNLKTLAWGTLLFLTLQVPSIADDTDIYINAAPAGSAEPMVFLTLDYRPNLGSTLCTEVSPQDPLGQCGLLLGEAYPNLDTGAGTVTLFEGLRAVFKTVFDELDGIQVAFMMNHDNSCSGSKRGGGPDVSGCSNGGYFLKGLKNFDATDSNGAKADMLEALASVPVPTGNLSHSYQGQELYFELFRYLTGQEWHNAHTGWTDFGTKQTFNLNVDYPDAAWDSAIESGDYYLTPFTSSTGYECTRMYAVNMMFQVSNQDSDNEDEIKASVAQGGLGISINNPDFDDIVEFMRDTDLAPNNSGDTGYGHWPDVDGNQNLTSYFIAAQVNNTTNGYASAGGTFSALPLTEPAVLLDDLRNIFKEILSISTTFVAASVPVNVFNRSDIVDNVFIAQFKVDPDGRANWNGNLKKLKLLESTDDLGSQTLSVVDATNIEAIATDGRIAYNALTYWTDAASLPAAEGDEVDGKDGRAIVRGGAGQKIPGFLTGAYIIGDNNGGNTRTVFTEPVSGTALMDLGVSNADLLQLDLGADDVFEAEELIRWIRGQDVDDLDADGDDDEARPWLLGAPLHSRPLPLNYGARGGYSTTNPDIRIFMGSEDGMMHAFRNTTSAGAESGVEDWAFMPRSVMDKMEILRTNSAGSHPYTVDGAPAAYVVDGDGNGTIDGSDKAYLYFGLRRGGKSYYALNVTNPDNPSMLWSIDKSGDFSELGMTFSSPRVGKVKFGADPTPVIIFGGGYDADKDTGAADDDEGNAIYVVNAINGSLIWKATYGSTTGSVSATEYHHSGMVDSIPSDLAALDTNSDGNIDRLYVGDTGGTIWRVDLPEGTADNRDSWFVSELANVGSNDASGSDKVNDRRFFHRPDFVPSNDEYGAFDGVLIGTGDRADPKDTQARNYFYLIKDRNVLTGVVTGTAYSQADLGDVTNTCIEDAVCTADLSNGWKMALEGVGEKALAPAITAFGTVYFTTFLPEGGAADAGTSCAPSEGGGRLYAVNMFTGAPVNNYDTSDGSDDINLTKSDRFDPLSSGGIPAEVVPIGGYILPPDLEAEPIDGREFWKTFWFEKDVDPES
jgi:type IV pilus assembly protein PilY1